MPDSIGTSFIALAAGTITAQAVMESGQIKNSFRIQLSLVERSIGVQNTATEALFNDRQPKHAGSGCHRPLPRPLTIPTVMNPVTLADVRTLIGHLPKETRARDTWRHVEAELKKPRALATRQASPCRSASV
jgi:hypothetical protein